MTPQIAPSTPAFQRRTNLDIGSVTAPIAAEEVKTIMPNEVGESVDLYLDGHIDRWLFSQDIRSGDCSACTGDLNTRRPTRHST
jgi:hypothetical protein